MTVDLPLSTVWRPVPARERGVFIAFCLCEVDYCARLLLKGAVFMPELSRFAGIIIKLLFNDTIQHNKPHVHVYYGEYQASVGIDGELLAGSLPVKQLRMVVGWLALHEDEAYAAWNKAVRGEAFDKIKPLA